ncbi:MAG: HAD-IG family 5'-nucleotidase [bacterium]
MAETPVEIPSALIHALPGRPPASRGIFCNRTLNLRSIQAIGYDLDYTLVHYNVITWERRAYEHLRDQLAADGWPVERLEFDPDLIIRGLVVDTALGNIVKANRFGYVKRAYHGMQPLNFETLRREYSRLPVDLTESRWVFLNTLFSLSKGCMYSQLVEKLDAHELPAGIGYAELYNRVTTSLDRVHQQGHLKAEIVAHPDDFVELDPEMPLALLDQREAGKRVLLITNSDWDYTSAMARYTFDRFLPGKMTWKDLFDLVIVSARKPAFFTGGAPAFEVMSADGMCQPCRDGIEKPGCYVGGHAALVERFLGHDQDEILYIGDHVFGDVHQSKSVRRWRTGLIARELEPEIEAINGFREHQEQLTKLMERKDQLGFRLSQHRLLLQRLDSGRLQVPGLGKSVVHTELKRLRAEFDALDGAIVPHVKVAGGLMNRRWGLLMRTGNDKSLMARHVERHADIYTSRVSNFLYETPHAYLRSSRGSLPHDPIPDVMLEGE